MMFKWAVIPRMLLARDTVPFINLDAENITSLGPALKACAG